jgi:hypothetical protein
MGVLPVYARDYGAVRTLRDGQCMFEEPGSSVLWAQAGGGAWGVGRGAWVSSVS